MSRTQNADPNQQMRQTVSAGLLPNKVLKTQRLKGEFDLVAAACARQFRPTEEADLDGPAQAGLDRFLGPNPKPIPKYTGMKVARKPNVQLLNFAAIPDPVHRAWEALLSDDSYSGQEALVRDPHASRSAQLGLKIPRALKIAARYKGLAQQQVRRVGANVGKPSSFEAQGQRHQQWVDHQAGHYVNSPLAAALTASLPAMQAYVKPKSSNIQCFRFWIADNPIFSDASAPNSPWKSPRMNGLPTHVPAFITEKLLEPQWGSRATKSSAKHDGDTGSSRVFSPHASRFAQPSFKRYSSFRSLKRWNSRKSKLSQSTVSAQFKSANAQADRRSRRPAFAFFLGRFSSFSGESNSSRSPQSSSFRCSPTSRIGFFGSLKKSYASQSRKDEETLWEEKRSASAWGAAELTENSRGVQRTYSPEAQVGKRRSPPRARKLHRPKSEDEKSQEGKRIGSEAEVKANMVELRAEIAALWKVHFAGQAQKELPGSAFSPMKVAQIGTGNGEVEPSFKHMTALLNDILAILRRRESQLPTHAALVVELQAVSKRTSEAQQVSVALMECLNRHGLLEPSPRTVARGLQKSVLEYTPEELDQVQQNIQESPAARLVPRNALSESAKTVSSELSTTSPSYRTPTAKAQRNKRGSTAGPRRKPKIGTPPAHERAESSTPQMNEATGAFPSRVRKESESHDASGNDEPLSEISRHELLRASSENPVEIRQEDQTISEDGLKGETRQKHSLPCDEPSSAGEEQKDGMSTSSPYSSQHSSRVTGDQLPSLPRSEDLQALFDDQATPKTASDSGGHRTTASSVAGLAIFSSPQPVTETHINLVQQSGSRLIPFAQDGGLFDELFESTSGTYSTPNSLSGTSMLTQPRQMTSSSHLKMSRTEEELGESQMRPKKKSWIGRVFQRTKRDSRTRSPEK